MTDIPDLLLEFLLAQATDKCRLAFLRVDTNDRIVGWGGELELYGIDVPTEGKPVVDVFAAAHDTAAINDDPGHIPRIRTETGRFVDMHVVADDEERWILLMDASEDAEKQSWVQQKANTLRLLESQLAKKVRLVATQPEESAANHAVLSALGAAAMYGTPDGRFLFRQPPPDWLTAMWPDAADPAGFCPQHHSPFLENFIVDAESCWEEPNPTVRWSGVWREPAPDGHDRSFEAVALNEGGQRILVILQTDALHREKMQWVQRARENALNHRRLVKEIEKKDVLLHCIIHDLRRPMISTRSCLELLSRENLSEKGASFLDVGLAELKRQDLLIRTILDAFKADVTAIEPRGETVSADVSECAEDVVAGLAPICALRGVTTEIELHGAKGTRWLVVGERARLTRVIGNLMDNALRYSTTGASIRIIVDDSGDHIRVAVEDEGPGVAPEFSHRLFDRFAQIGPYRGNVGLGLHFCRITVEAWGGKVGHENRETGGSRFWFTLPRPATTEGT